MKIEFTRNKKDEYEIKMVGRLDECNVVVEAFENSAMAPKAITDLTNFLRKKYREFKG